MQCGCESRGSIRWLSVGAVFLLICQLTLTPIHGMEVLGSLGLSNRRGVAVQDTVAFAVGNTNLTAVSIARPRFPSALGQLELSMTLQAIDVQGDFAYCAGGANGFAVVNISNPRAPYWVHTTSLTGACLDIAVEDTILAVAIGTAVVIVGVRNPSTPHVLGSYVHAANSVALHGSAHRLYVGGSTNGVIELDITDPAHPQWRSQFGAGQPATPVAYSVPYVDAARNATLYTLRASPLGQAGAFAAAAAIRAVSEAGGYQTLVGLANGDVIHLDETEMPPDQVGSVSVGAEVRRIDTGIVDSQDLAVVATADGVTIVGYDPVSSVEEQRWHPAPSGFQILAYPNPFNTSVKLQLVGAKNGWHTFEVFELTGRRVVTRRLFFAGLAEFTFEPGSLATGAYIARVTGTSGSALTRLILLK